jgi:tetratricopeptide (TPR) repeat protein
LEITAAPSDILAYAAHMNLGEYYRKKYNFDLALDAFHDALCFARQKDFDTRPALCSLGDLSMDAELFDQAIEYYTEA